MYSEHIIYSAAIAIIVGMIYFRFTRRDPSWIIIIFAFVPDIDLALENALQMLHRLFRTSFHYPVVAIHHGDFHNIVFLILFSLLSAAILRQIGIRYVDGFICSAVGFGAHLFEDALVFNPAWKFFWPISSKLYGIGVMQESRNFFWIADGMVLLIGLIFLAFAVLIRTLVDGKGWWRVFLQGGRIEKNYGILRIN